MSTLAGTGIDGANDGQASTRNETVRGIKSLALFPDNQTLYVADSTKNAIRKVENASGEGFTLTGNGTVDG